MKYKTWIEETKTGLDYYSAFIKTWIAFNSWYREKYNDLEPKNTDRAIINEIKSSENSFRSELIHILKNNSTYIEHLDLLHHSLIQTSIETKNFQGVTESISLSNIAITNMQKNVDDTRNNVYYKINRTNTRINIMVKDSNDQEIFKCVQIEYSLEDLETINPTQWEELTDPQKTHLKSLYSELRPFKIISLINNNPEEDDFIMSGQNKYINNYERIAEGLIEALYLLRCALFHGEISAKEETKSVYKCAYNLLNPIIKKL